MLFDDKNFKQKMFVFYSTRVPLSTRQNDLNTVCITVYQQSDTCNVSTTLLDHTVKDICYAGYFSAYHTFTEFLLSPCFGFTNGT